MLCLIGVASLNNRKQGVNMNLKNKNVLILGLGISGVSTVKALNKLGAKISISDLKDEKDLKLIYHR